MAFQDLLVLDVAIELRWLGDDKSCHRDAQTAVSATPVAEMLQEASTVLSTSVASGSFKNALDTIASNGGSAINLEALQLVSQDDRSAGLTVQLEAATALMELHSSELLDTLAQATVTLQALVRDLQLGEAELAMFEADFTLNFRVRGLFRLGLVLCVPLWRHFMPFIIIAYRHVHH
jgi:hypothetical protein